MKYKALEELHEKVQAEVARLDEIAQAKAGECMKLTGERDEALSCLRDVTVLLVEANDHDEDYGHLLSDEPDECCVCKAHKLTVGL